MTTEQQAILELSELIQNRLELMDEIFAEVIHAQADLVDAAKKWNEQLKEAA